MTTREQLRNLVDQLPEDLLPSAMELLQGLGANKPQSWPEQPPFEFKTERARRLWELRQQNIAAGARLLSQDEINEEVARRRGQRPWPDAD